MHVQKVSNYEKGLKVIKMVKIHENYGLLHPTQKWALQLKIE
jgi:hypothetical protein